MTFAPDQIKALQAPLDRRAVETRSQSGQTLSYVANWHVLNEANRIFGFDGWHSETLEMRLVAERECMIGKSNPKPGWRVSYVSRVRITVFAGDRILVREGVGAGHGIDADLGGAHESASKEAESDSQKRAFRTFGNPFGLALYDKTQSNVVDMPEPPPPPARPKMTPDEWRSAEMKRLETMLKRGDVDGIRSWPAAEHKALTALQTKNPEAHAKLLAFHAEMLAQTRAAG